MRHHIVTGPEAYIDMRDGKLTLVRPGPYGIRYDVFKRVEFKTRGNRTRRLAPEWQRITNLGLMEVFV